MPIPATGLRQQLYHMHVVQGMSYGDIAQETGLTRNRIGGLIWREKRKRQREQVLPALEKEPIDAV